MYKIILKYRKILPFDFGSRPCSVGRYRPDLRPFVEILEANNPPRSDALPGPKLYFH